MSKIAVQGGCVPGLSPVSGGCSSLVGSWANASQPSTAASRVPVSFPALLSVRTQSPWTEAALLWCGPTLSRYVCKDLIFQTRFHSEGLGARTSAYEFRGAGQPVADACTDNPK